MRAAASLLSTLLVVVSLTEPVHAGTQWTHVTFVAAVPCAVACPDWLGVLNRDLDADGEDDLYFDPCGSPAPWSKGTTYDEVLIDPIPQRADVLIFDLFPSVDFDGYICEYEDTWDEDGEPNENLASGGAVILFEECSKTGPNPPIPDIGCRERMQIPARAGKRVILRAYNVIDPTGEATGRFGLVDL